MRFVRLEAVGFLLNGNWEWLQTPLYDNSGVGLDMIVWYRLHCTMVDAWILAVVAALVSLWRRGTAWLDAPTARELLSVALLGAPYSAASEQVNVGLLGKWGCSAMMPTRPGTSIGLSPLLQWLLLPAAALWLGARLGSRRR